MEVSQLLQFHNFFNNVKKNDICQIKETKKNIKVDDCKINDDEVSFEHYSNRY